MVTPISFVLNKLWTFSAVRGKNSVAGSDIVDLDPEHAQPSQEPRPQA